MTKAARDASLAIGSGGVAEGIAVERQSAPMGQEASFDYYTNVSSPSNHFLEVLIFIDQRKGGDIL